MAKRRTRLDKIAAQTRRKVRALRAAMAVQQCRHDMEMQLLKNEHEIKIEFLEWEYKKIVRNSCKRWCFVSLAFYAVVVGWALWLTGGK